MEKLAYLMLPLLLILLVVRTRQDIEEYNDFKKLKSTKARQKEFKRWILQSFGLFGLGSIFSLAAIGKLGLLIKPLPVFSKLIPTDSAPSIVETIESDVFIFTFIFSAVAFGIIFVAWIIGKNNQNKKELVIGDIEAMIPKNRDEWLLVVLLSLNAGISEELLFRIVLPVLFFIVFGNTTLAAGLAIITFGLVHWYQGKLGILFASLMGAGFMYVYLWTGNIFMVMALHAGIDINSLVIQPYFRRRFTKRN